MENFPCNHGGDVNACDPLRTWYNRQHKHKSDMKDIEILMKAKDIPKFERQCDISVSIYVWENASKTEDGKKSTHIM